jgi:hypothetical protein
MNLDKPINGLKNPKKHTKTQNLPKTKIFFKLRFIFLGTFKIKKKKAPKLNSPYKIEPFDINIDRFSSRNKG